MKLLPNDWEQLIDRYISIKYKVIALYRKAGRDTTYNELLILRAITIKEELARDVKFGLKEVVK